MGPVIDMRVTKSFTSANLLPPSRIWKTPWQPDLHTWCRHEWTLQRAARGAVLQHVAVACPSLPSPADMIQWVHGPASGPTFNYLLSSTYDGGQRNAIWFLNADIPGMTAQKLKLRTCKEPMLAYASRDGFLHLVQPRGRHSENPDLADRCHWSKVHPKTCQVRCVRRPLYWNAPPDSGLPEHMYSAASHRVLSMNHLNVAVLDADTCQEVVSFRVEQVQDWVEHHAGGKVECYMKYVQWSPSGGLLAFMLQEDDSQQICEVHVHDAASGQRVHLLLLTACLMKMQWSPVADLLAVWGPGVFPPFCDDGPHYTVMDAIRVLDPCQKKTTLLAGDPADVARDVYLCNESWDSVGWSSCGTLLLARRKHEWELVADPESGERIPGAEMILAKGCKKISWALAPVAGQGKKLAEAFIAPKTVMRIWNSGATWHVEATELSFQPPCDGLASSCIAPNGRSIVSWKPVSSEASSLYHYDLGSHCGHTLIPSDARSLVHMEWPRFPPGWQQSYSLNSRTVEHGQHLLQLINASTHKLLAGWTPKNLIDLVKDKAHKIRSTEIFVHVWSVDSQHVAVMLDDGVLIVTFKL